MGRRTAGRAWDGVELGAWEWGRRDAAPTFPGSGGFEPFLTEQEFHDQRPLERIFTIFMTMTGAHGVSSLPVFSDGKRVMFYIHFFLGGQLLKGLKRELLGDPYESAPCLH